MGENRAKAAWLTDPTGRHQLRYWNGNQWTKYAADMGLQVIDAMTCDDPTRPPMVRNQWDILGRERDRYSEWWKRLDQQERDHYKSEAKLAAFLLVAALFVLVAYLINPHGPSGGG